MELLSTGLQQLPASLKKKKSNIEIKTSSVFHLLNHAPGVLWEGIKGKK